MRSVDPLVRWGRVHKLESGSSAFVKDTFGSKALVLVVTVSGHALSESGEVNRALFLEDILAR